MKISYVFNQNILNIPVYKHFYVNKIYLPIIKFHNSSKMLTRYNLWEKSIFPYVILIEFIEYFKKVK